MREPSGADRHQKYRAALRKYGGVDPDAIVCVLVGSRWGVRLRGFIGPLKLKYAYLAGSGREFQVWALPGPKGTPIGLVAAYERPVVELKTGRWTDQVSVEGRSFLVATWQRPYLRELLEIAATPPATAMAGLPAGWYHDPWSFPNESPGLRFWNGIAWTSDVNPRPADPT